MNGRLLKSMQGAAWTTLRPWRALAASVVLGLAGCADIQRATSLPPVNPESPVASAVANAARRTPPTPSFRDVPPVLRNVPAPADVKLATIAMIRCRRAFEQFETAHPQLVYGGPAFAAEQRTRVDDNPADAPTPTDTAVAEAFAAKLRGYADPPPALASGPPPTASEALPPGAGSAKPVSASPPRPVSPPRTAPHPIPSPHAVAVAPPRTADPAPAAFAQIDPRQARATAGLAAIPPTPEPVADPLLARCR